MNDIYLLQGFNNYFNRKVKYYADLESYKSAAEYDSFPNVNFNPGDGVRTTHVVGSQTQILSGMPDYLLVVNDADEIVSRWFVTDANFTRNGQYQLSLKRDSLADHYRVLLETPMYVEKGMLPVENPLIFNSEGNSYNQIKKSEHLLKDETGTNWIVGYMATDAAHEGDIISVDPSSSVQYPELASLGLTLNDENDPSKGASFKSLSTYMYVQVRISYVWAGNYSYYDVQARYTGDEFKTFAGSGGYDNGRNGVGGCLFNANSHRDELGPYWAKRVNAKYNILYRSIINQLSAAGAIPLTKKEVADIRILNGKIVYSAANSKYYQLVIESSKADDYKGEVEGALYTELSTIGNAFYEEVKNVKEDVWGGTRSYFGISDPAPAHRRNPYHLYVGMDKTTVRLQEVPGPGTRKVQIAAGRQHLTDAPFDMFAIPYTPENLNLTTQINLALGQKIYDIQLVPYCPVRSLMTPTGINLSLGTEGKDYTLITNNDGAQLGYMLWASVSSDSFVIYHKIPVAHSPVELKVQNECDVYRLSSPNYNGVFEFSVAKNGGVDYFEVNYTYKPYSPYIHVCPNFKRMYGDDFDDARGLICNGDFSIAMTSDAWTTYEINNKNYQNIFNTEIKTMDKMHRNQMISQGIGSFLGAGAAGAGAGLLTKKLGVGLVGGLASLGGGIADLGLAQDNYNTQRQAKVDMYNYQLGNIKARPDSLTKISAYNINNKYFPFVEHYSATDEEKDALRQQIRFNGMTVMAIGRPVNYLGTNNYFKAQMLRCEVIKEDAHMINDIYNELNMGVYLNG